MKSFSLVICFLIFAATTAIAEEKSEPFELSIENQPLDSVLKILRDKSGYNIFAQNPAGDAGPISLALKQATWREALDILASDNGLTLRTHEAWGKLILLEREKRVTLQYNSADIRLVLDEWSKQSEGNLIVGGDVDGYVKIDVVNVPASVALAKIRAESKCEFVAGPFDTTIVLGAESFKKWKAAREAQRAYVLGTKNEPAAAESASKLLNLKQENLLGFIDELQQLQHFDKYGKWAKEFKRARVELHDITALGALEFATRRYGIGVDTDRLGTTAAYFPGNEISFTFNKLGIRDVINTIGIQSDANIIIHHEIEGNITARINNVPAEPILRMIANSQGFAVVKEPEGFWFVANAEKIAKRAKPVAQGRVVSIVFDNVKLSEAVARIAGMAHAEINFADAKFKEWTLSMRLDNIHWKTAMATMLRSMDLEMTEQQNGTFLIQSIPDDSKK